MIIEKLAIYAAIAVIASATIALGVILFGTLKFLKVITALQAKLIAVNTQVAEAAKEATSLQNDLSMQRQWLMNNKCNCMKQSEANNPVVEL